MTLIISGDITLRNGFQWNETVWNPSMIQTALWLDAADISTITESGGLVNQIDDKSGNNRNFTASTTTRPTLAINELNGLPVLSFGGSQYLTSVNPASTWNFMHNATGCTIMTVVQMGASSNPDQIYGLLGTSAGTNSNTGIFTAFDDRSSVSRNNGFVTGVGMGIVATPVSSNLAIDVWSPNQYVLFGQALDNSNNIAAQRNIVRLNAGSEIANNAANQTPSTSDATFTLQVGACGNNSVPAVLKLPELIVISSSIDSDTRQRIEGYLAHKWGLTANLPADHPYKTVGPTP